MLNTESISVIVVSDSLRLSNELSSRGIDIINSDGGFDVIQTASEKKPDAVILETSNNGLSLSTLALFLKLNPATASIPVIGFGSQDSQDVQELDYVIRPNTDLSDITDLISECRKQVELPDELSQDSVPTSLNPIDLSLSAINIYRERLKISESVMKLGGLQHDLGNFEHFIRSVLKTCGKILDSDFICLTLFHEKTQYIQIKGANHSVKELDLLRDFVNSNLPEHYLSQFPIEEELVFGRNRLNETPTDENIDIHFYGHALIANGQTIGYLAASASDVSPDIKTKNGLLPELCSQIASVILNTKYSAADKDSVNELVSVLRAAVETSSISPVSDVSQKSFLFHFLLIVLELCKNDRGCIVLFDENGKVSETAALGCTEEEVLNEELSGEKTVYEVILGLQPGDLIQDCSIRDGNRSRRLITPLATGKKILGALVLDKIPHNLSSRILDAIETLTGLAASFVYNRILHLRSIASSILEDQLKLAREIQEQMLPDKHPDYPGYDIFGISKAAKQVGGDYFDYLQYDNGALGIVIADVCGKSIPASLLMTMTRALFIAAGDGSIPKNVITTVNSHLVRLISEGRFVTAGLLTINGEKLSLAMGGHTPLLVYRAKNDEFEEIQPDGIALGIIDTIEFEQEEVILDEGDIALLYTDGLSEAMNPERVQFGLDRVKEVIREFAAEDSQTIVDVLFKATEIHTDGIDRSDDTTIIAIKKNRSELQ